MKQIDIEGLINRLCYIDPQHDGEDINNIEKDFVCRIKVEIEKHNPLQFTYFYEVDFGKEEMFYIEIENGINNGTQVNSAEWGYNTFNKTKIIEVLKDFELDMRYYKKGSFEERKAKEILNNNKSKLFEFYRQNSYDNYVTGGNSKMKLDPLLRQLYIRNIYEEKEVDCNLI